MVRPAFSDLVARAADCVMTGAGTSNGLMISRPIFTAHSSLAKLGAQNLVLIADLRDRHLKRCDRRARPFRRARSRGVVDIAASSPGTSSSNTPTAWKWAAPQSQRRAARATQCLRQPLARLHQPGSRQRRQHALQPAAASTWPAPVSAAPRRSRCDSRCRSEPERRALHNALQQLTQQGSAIPPAGLSTRRRGPYLFMPP